MGIDGRVIAVNVSDGGVPKLPVERAWVGWLGLEGDAHRERTVHGGPHRAVCLFGIEAIERLQSEGHPVEPGSVGENLTTSGVEWSTLPVGTQVQVGDDLLLELASPTMPCATQRHNFRDGRFSRISIDLHPSDSRMYARVLVEGEARPGDAIVLRPPPADSRAEREGRLARLDRALARSSLLQWRAAERAGFDLRIVDDGELAMVAAPSLPGPPFNQALGLARLPNLVPEAAAFLRGHGVQGWLLTDRPPWPRSEPDVVFEVFAADPSAIAGEAPTDGLSLRRVAVDETEAVQAVYAASAEAGDDVPSPWPYITAAMAADAHSAVLLAELDGRPVGTGSVFVTHHTGWLRAGTVVPSARGRGIQRALIGARVDVAASMRCDLVGAMAEAGSVSARNLGRLGFEVMGTRELHRLAAPNE